LIQDGWGDVEPSLAGLVVVAQANYVLVFALRLDLDESGHDTRAAFLTLEARGANAVEPLGAAVPDLESAEAPSSGGASWTLIDRPALGTHSPPHGASTLLGHVVGARRLERDPGVPTLGGDPPNRQGALAGREPRGYLSEHAPGADRHVVRMLHRDCDVPVASTAQLLDGAAEQIHSQPIDSPADLDS
jgi:hypothetical protein